MAGNAEDATRTNSKGPELKIQQKLTTKSLNNSEFAAFKRDPTEVMSINSRPSKLSEYARSIKEQPAEDVISKQFSEVLASIKSGKLSHKAKESTKRSQT